MLSLPHLSPWQWTFFKPSRCTSRTKKNRRDARRGAERVAQVDRRALPARRHDLNVHVNAYAYAYVYVYVYVTAERCPRGATT